MWRLERLCNLRTTIHHKDIVPTWMFRTMDHSIYTFFSFLFWSLLFWFTCFLLLIYFVDVFVWSTLRLSVLFSFLFSFLFDIIPVFLSAKLWFGNMATNYCRELLEIWKEVKNIASRRDHIWPLCTKLNFFLWLAVPCMIKLFI